MQDDTDTANSAAAAPELAFDDKELVTAVEDDGVLMTEDKDADVGCVGYSSATHHNTSVRSLALTCYIQLNLNCNAIQYLY